MFRFFDHTGDIGIDLDAPDAASLFVDAAHAFAETIAATEGMASAEVVTVRLAASALDLLLVDWLNELLFRFDTTGWLLHEVEARVERRADGWSLEATAAGGHVAPDTPVKVAVKAVTYHELSAEQSRDGRWRAHVILDI